MVRIIPWDLPSVAGGSIGGYTPQPTPEPPATKYYDFDNAEISSFIGLVIDMTSVGSTPKTLTPKGGISSGAIGGIDIINLVGVSSVSVLFKNVCSTTFSGSPATIDTDTTDGIVLNLDPLTLALDSYVSGTAEVTCDTTQSIMGLTIAKPTGSNSGSMTFYVYNGNGEIIQQQEVTLS